ncbi:hypothetical protein BDR05DRAFT_969791 [Suillus weaverae]|nr:hypothetical protein BDR05DRAFT_969791 [Suillus weaverae]
MGWRAGYINFGWVLQPSKAIMRVPTSITVLCTLVAYATAQCMECASSVTYNSLTYDLKEQCTVRSGYHCL